MARKKQGTERSLVIVESPAKAKTINRYLGSGFEVLASVGHVRDLPPNDLGIDFDNDFEPVYQILDNKRSVVKKLRSAAAKADSVYLATDMDREGEAIAWHLMAALDLKPERTYRVVFNEITKSAIQAAFASPHQIDMEKVNAQQARRLLDRIVGYQLSPLLQRKIKPGLSAGRVQSVAVRLIVTREHEIRAFVPTESWRITACLATDLTSADAQAKAWGKFIKSNSSTSDGPTIKDRNAFLSKHGCLYAELTKVAGKEFACSNAADATAIAESLGFVTETVDEQPLAAYADKGFKSITLKGRTDRDSAPTFTIKEVKKRRTQSRPAPPFATAALQQAASTTLGFTPKRTMGVAQGLYEGVDLGDSDGPVGLITYMRTDSTHLSAGSIETARTLIADKFGKNYLPDKPRIYASGKRAQEAHEAIRPSDPNLTPESLRKSLSAEQFKLYDLIWRRFIACQMLPAQWDSTTILIAADTPKGEALFRTSGRRLVFDGFLKVFKTLDSPDVILPDLAEDDEVALLHLDPRQQFSSPPARYNEASLVKKLEAEGIGRPSTYAAILQKIKDTRYVESIDNKLHATALGEIVTEKLVQHFPKIMDIKFTSFMEEELDKVEDAHLDWVHVLNEFYGPFKEALDRAQVEMERAGAQPSPHMCPECGKSMVYRIGKNGRFLSCSAYPDCKVARNIDDDGNPVDNIVADEPCEVCGKEMQLKKSRLGPFLGCSGYPDCTNTLPSDEFGVPLKKVKPEDIKEKCEECDSKMTVKFARGRTFLGCSAYPKCKATQPIPPGIYVEKPKPKDAGVRCDKCGRAIVIRTSSRGEFLSCSGFPRCRNAMPMDKLDHLKQLLADGKIPDPPPESANGKGAKTAKGKAVKVDIASLGPPPEGFAWTRTGRPVVETWPEESLKCPDCGKDVSMKSGRFGPYFGCTSYPKCRFVSNLRGAAKKQAEAENPTPPKPKPIPTDIPCDECGEPMVIRSSRGAQFLGCSKYPKCKFSKPIPDGVTAESLAVTPSTAT